VDVFCCTIKNFNSAINQD